MGAIATTPKSKRGRVRIGTAAAIPQLLRSFGLNPSDVLAEANLDPDLFDDPDNTITYAARNHLVGLCVARTGCRHFGLLLGQQVGLSALGLMGFLVKQSPHVEGALLNLLRYMHLQVRGATTTLSVDGDSAKLGYAIHLPRIEASDQLADGAIAMAFNVMRELCGPEWSPTAAMFTHRQPEDIGPFRRFFRVPLHFDASQNALVFSAQWLRRRVHGADPELRRLLQQQIDAIEARHRDNFQEQVRRVLHSVLLTDRGTADQVAALFSMHSRTLNRRLNAFGTSFQELADEGRCAIALRMLEDSPKRVDEIASMLRYSNASAFTRAFRRWTGTTPSDWRATRNSAG